VFSQAPAHGFVLHHRQPTVRCLPGAHRERGIRLLLFTRASSQPPHAATSPAVLTPAFAAVASRLSPLAYALLIERCDTSMVSADRLLDSIDAISPTDKAAARIVLHGSADRAAHRAVVLSAAHCAALRGHCRSHLSMEADSVVRETNAPLLVPFSDGTRSFAKTGSGRGQGTLKRFIRRVLFCRMVRQTHRRKSPARSCRSWWVPRLWQNCGGCLLPRGWGCC
jgi:hypothetical protein